MSSAKPNPFKIPEMPEVISESWYVPLDSPVYVWYKNATNSLQSARLSYKTSKSCPNCNSKTSVNETPRSIECSNCNWKIDLRGITVISPAKLKETLQKDLDSAKALLYQSKYEMTYREVNMELFYNAFHSKQETIEKQLEDLKTIKPNTPFLILTPKK